MAKKEVLYPGKIHTVELAVTFNGKCPAKKFLIGLSKDDREKFLRVIKHLADEGRIGNREQFKKIEGEDFFLNLRTSKSGCLATFNRVAG